MSRRADRELQVGQIVARTLNERDGCDYQARPGARLPAPPDVELWSPSGAHQPLELEVTSAPIAGAPGTKPLRRDREDSRQLKERVANSLLRVGINDAHVQLRLEDGVVPASLKPEHVAAIIRFVRTCPIGKGHSLHGRELRAHDEALPSVVASVLARRTARRKQPTVVIEKADAVPSDGRWIAEAVDQKRAKYGDEVARKFSLAVDCDDRILDEQIQAYCSCPHPRSAPFAQVWLVTPRMPISVRAKP